MGDNQAIKKRYIYSILSHRGPMALLDQIVHFHVGGNGEDTLTAKFKVRWAYCFGHFGFRPKNWILPGVYLLEAMAQACGMLTFLKSYRGVRKEERPLGNLASANVKLRKPAKPGDTIFLKVEFLQKKGPFAMFKSEARLNGEDGELIAEANKISLFLIPPRKK